MTTLIVAILSLTVKALKLVLVIGLVAGSVQVAKKYLFSDEKFNFSFKTGEKPAAALCSCCQAKLETGHRFCPSCGAAAETVTGEKTAVETA